MTMVRAQVLLWASIALAVFAGWFVLRNIDLQLDNPSAPTRPGGAVLSDNPAAREGRAIPKLGGASSIGSPDVAATITAILRTAMATPGASARTPAAGPPVAVGLGQPIDIAGVRYTVHQVVDPEPPGFFATLPGRRRIALDVSVEALTEPSQYEFTRFRLQDDTTGTFGWALSNTKPAFDRGTLQPGESHRGWLSFQVPPERTAAGLFISPPGSSQRILIADFAP